MSKYKLLIICNHEPMMEEEEEKMRLVKMETRDVEEKRDGKEEH